MNPAVVWWMLAGLALVAEVMTGTFYLLMFSSGLIAAAMAAHLGLSSTVQVLAAAVIGGVATYGWHIFKQRKEKAGYAPAHANADVNMDIGQTVTVEAWNADGTASVNYRGAAWAAQAAAGQALERGNFRIREVLGSRLILERV